MLHTNILNAESVFDNNECTFIFKKYVTFYKTNDAVTTPHSMALSYIIFILFVSPKEFRSI